MDCLTSRILMHKIPLHPSKYFHHVTATAWRQKKKDEDGLKKGTNSCSLHAIIITVTTCVICQQISSGKISPICVGRTGRAVDKLTAYENKRQGCFTCSLRCRATFVLEGLQSLLAQALQFRPELSANIYTRRRPY